MVISVGLFAAWLIHRADNAAESAKMKYTGEFIFQLEPNHVISLTLLLDGTFVLDGGSCGASNGNWELHDSDMGHVIDFRAHEGFHAQAAAYENELGFFSFPRNLDHCPLEHPIFRRVGSE
jgi:hypothetical protein